MKKYPDEERLSHISKLWSEDKDQAIKLSWEWIKTGKFTKVEYKILLEQYAKHITDNMCIDIERSKL